MPGDLCFYGAWDRNRENKNSLTPQTPCGGYTDTRLVKVKKREKKTKEDNNNTIDVNCQTT